ncbi:hypothetical protein D9M72_314320 [compost metagenome]
MVTSELVVSFIATTVLVAGRAIAITMMNGTMVQITSTVMLSWKAAGFAPLDLRCLNTE